MLTKLRQHHHAIRTLLTALEGLCQAQHPDMAKLSLVRLELTRASRARSAYLNLTIYPWLERTCPPDKRVQLARLKSEGILMLVRAGDHMRRWTVRHIANDWQGYRSASKAARASMHARIEREAQLIYPLLDEQERASG